MIKNQVTLMGRVGKYKDTQCYDSGTVVTTVNLGVKRGESKYNNFFIKFFDTETCGFADWIANNLAEGDYIQVIGKLQVNEYEVDNKPKSSIQVVGYEIYKVFYNDQTEDWVYKTGENTQITAYNQRNIKKVVQECTIDDELGY